MTEPTKLTDARDKLRGAIATTATAVTEAIAKESTRIMEPTTALHADVALRLRALGEKMKERAAKKGQRR